MSFPSYPAGCPPIEAVPAIGIVYRIAMHNPLQDEDFQSQLELGQALNADDCLRRSLSVFREVRDAVHRRQKTPKLGKYIAKGILDQRHGVTKHTGGQKSSHTEWWACEEIDRKEPFTILIGV